MRTLAAVALPLFAFLAAAGLALSAPAPMPKPPAAHPPAPRVAPAAYVMNWHGSDCRTWLHAGGAYACLWCGSPWEGTWECERGVLKVAEWPVANPAAVLRWEVILGPCGMKGVLAPGKAAWSIRFAPAEGGGA